MVKKKANPDIIAEYKPPRVKKWVPWGVTWSASPTLVDAKPRIAETLEVPVENVRVKKVGSKTWS